MAVGLYLPYFDGFLSGIELHLLAHLAAALQKGSCDNRSESFHCKYTVYRQTEQLLLLASGACRPYLIHYHLFQHINIFSGIGRYLDAVGLFHEGTFNQIVHIIINKLSPVLIHQVGLGKHHNTLLDMKHLKNLKMLNRLRHNALIQGNHQKHQVDAANTCQHVLHKLLMARYIYDSNMDSGVIGQVGKSQLNGYSPFLLLLQPVRIRPCKGLYETCLAVVHMTGCSHYYILHIITPQPVCCPLR